MQWCSYHANKIARERKSLGLQEAKLRLEFRGVDVDNDPRLDGYFCPICTCDAEYSATKDTDGKLLISVWTEKNTPYLITD